jgi:tRNA-binding EMAP/Myf-like protein
MKRIIIGLVIALASTQSAMAEETLYCQGMVCSTTPPDPSKFANFDVKNDKGEVVSSVWSHVDHVPAQTTVADPICSNCQIVRQPEPELKPVIPVINEQETSTVTSGITNVTVLETTTAKTKVETATVLTVTPKVISILDEELDLTWEWDKVIAWIVAWFDTFWIKP